MPDVIEANGACAVATPDSKSVPDHTVFAVVVTFHPDMHVLDRLLGTLKHQVQKIVIVDNSATVPARSSIARLATSSITPIFLQANAGIATGFNVGCRYADTAGATHVLLFDQDSEAAGNLVASLLEAEYGLIKAGQKVAVVGPSVFEERSQASHDFVQLDGKELKFLKRTKQSDVVESSWVISSGSLIRLESWRRIGPFADELFIDLVDIEWCLRARKNGYVVAGAFSAALLHHLGDSALEMPQGCVPLHSPSRCYYQVRNSLYLSNRDYMPRAFLRRHARNLALVYAYAVWKRRASWRHLQMIGLGVFHAMISRVGPCNMAQPAPAMSDKRTADGAQRN